MMPEVLKITVGSVTCFSGRSDTILELWEDQHGADFSNRFLRHERREVNLGRVYCYRHPNLICAVVFDGYLAGGPLEYNRWARNMLSDSEYSDFYRV